MQRRYRKSDYEVQQHHFPEGPDIFTIVQQPAYPVQFHNLG
jgi:hypothetical protein